MTVVISAKRSNGCRLQQNRELPVNAAPTEADVLEFLYAADDPSSIEAVMKIQRL